MDKIPVPAVEIIHQIEYENRQILAVVFAPLVIQCLANPEMFDPEYVSIITAFVNRNETSEHLLGFYKKLDAWEKNGSPVLKEHDLS